MKILSINPKYWRNYSHLMRILIIILLLQVLCSSCNRNNLGINSIFSTSVSENPEKITQTVKDVDPINTQEYQSKVITPSNKDDNSSGSDSYNTNSEENFSPQMLGLSRDNFYKIYDFNVDQIMKRMTEISSEYPYHYIIYTGVGKGLIIYGKSKPSVERSFAKISEEGDTSFSLVEPWIFAKFMSFGYYSEFSQNSFFQTVVLVTQEEGDDGINRNGFFSYSKYGLALFIDEDNNDKVIIWRGDQILIDNPEIQSLFKEGYTQVRKIDGKYIGMFNIHSLPTNPPDFIVE